MPKLVFFILTIMLFSCSNEGINDETNILEKTVIATLAPDPSPTPEPTPEPTLEPTPGTIIPTPTSRLINIHLLNEEITELNIIFNPDSIRKYIQFTVPNGKILKQLILNKYVGDDKIAFYGIYKTVEIWEPNEEIVPYLSAWGHIESEKFIGKNILSYSESLELTIDQRDGNGYVTLKPGTYVMIVQNGNITNAEYEFSFILE